MQRFLQLSILLSTIFSSQTVQAKSTKMQWDFDHKVNYILYETEPRTYYLEVPRKLDTKFARMATFMMRKSHEVCGSYRYNIEVIKGVEGFDDRKSFPNMIMPSLVATIKCAS